MEVAASYSISEEDNAVIACFFELHVMAPNARLKTLLEVLLLPSEHPAQSLTVKPNNLNSET